jgi:uncharacterized protein
MFMAPADGAWLNVQVAYSPQAGQIELVAVQLPPGSLLGDALAASGLIAQFRLAGQALGTGVWGKAKGLEHALQDRDRVEIYRELVVDPKEARRLRYQRETKARKVLPRRSTDSGT